MGLLGRLRYAYRILVVAAAAVVIAEQANQTVARLGASSAEVGDVVRVITAIAEQTDLLALNDRRPVPRRPARDAGYMTASS